MSTSVYGSSQQKLAAKTVYGWQRRMLRKHHELRCWGTGEMNLSDLPSICLSGSGDLGFNSGLLMGTPRES